MIYRLVLSLHTPDMVVNQPLQLEDCDFPRPGLAWSPAIAHMSHHFCLVSFDGEVRIVFRK